MMASLASGSVGAAGDQRTSVAHALAGRAVTPAMKPTTRLLHVGLAPLSSFGFVGARRFGTDHDTASVSGSSLNAFITSIVLQTIDRVTTDADGGLAHEIPSSVS